MAMNLKQDWEQNGEPHWERRVVRELYREYQSVLHPRRAILGRAAIELFDSETCWGRWDPQTRTISISRQLVREYSWFHVVAILRHEMAHQWVDENRARVASGDEGPHGVSFRRACELLGVPAEYSGAKANLRETPLDWRVDQRGPGAEKLLEKVRKLLALATSSNEHEASLAMNKVRELYAKYGLEQVGGSAEERFAHLIIPLGKKRREVHERRVAGILVEHFFVEVISVPAFDAATGDRLWALELVGARENVQMAEYVYHFLLQQTESLVKVREKAQGRRFTRQERKSYRLGIIAGFGEKLAEAERASGADASPAPPTGGRSRGNELSLVGRALATFRSDRELANYLKRIYPRLRSQREGVQYVDSDAHGQGARAGRSITLHRAVTTRGGNLGKYLPG